MSPENEDILVQLAKDVDGSYPRLWSMYTDRLYADVVQKILNKEDARDIIQDVFERVYRHLKSYPPERILKLQLDAWLYKITKNACLNYQMRYQARRPLSLDTSEGSPYLDVPDTRSETPDMIAERREDRYELLYGLSRIPKKYQEPLFLRFFKDMSNDEIAESLHQKVGTVRGHVSRGITQLRQILVKPQPEQHRGNGKEKKDVEACQLSQHGSLDKNDHSQESQYRHNQCMVNDNE